MNTLKVGILGSGTMGKQIALLCASHGLPVVIWNHKLNTDFKKDFRRIALIESKLGNLDRKVANNIVDEIQYVDDMSEMMSCDLLIEAVTENYEIKKEVLTRLVSVVDDKKVISSNTSSLSITSLASLSATPMRFVGVHFFNPPMSMKLVEVVKGEHTSDETVFFILQFLTMLDKHPVVLPETPGFIVNRLLFPMINEAIFLLTEGIADVKTIDSCLKMGANHPMGPLELADLIGLDICLSILETLVSETGDGKYRPAPLLKKYVRAGKLGKKTGIGFYSYGKRG